MSKQQSPFTLRFGTEPVGIFVEVMKQRGSDMRAVLERVAKRTGERSRRIESGGRVVEIPLAPNKSASFPVQALALALRLSSPRDVTLMADEALRMLQNVSIGPKANIDGEIVTLAREQGEPVSVAAIVSLITSLVPKALSAAKGLMPIVMAEIDRAKEGKDSGQIVLATGGIAAIPMAGRAGIEDGQRIGRGEDPGAVFKERLDKTGAEVNRTVGVGEKIVAVLTGRPKPPPRGNDIIGVGTGGNVVVDANGDVEKPFPFKLIIAGVAALALVVVVGVVVTR